jgi:hypothetical protein
MTFTPTDQKLVFTLDEFCAAHSISRSYFYLLQKRGEAPRTMSGVGDRRLITVEEAKRWREARTVNDAA